MASKIGPCWALRPLPPPPPPKLRALRAYSYATEAKTECRSHPDVQINNIVTLFIFRYKGMDKNIHLRSIRIWLYLYVASSIVLAIICISCFFIFLYYVHLGWTVLSNQFCLISIMVFSSLYVTRVTLAVFRVREDQHKAVLCEAVLMLRELGLEKCACSSNTSSDRVAARESVKKFVAALNSMELFEKPRHIDLHRSYREQYQRIGEMETSFTNSSNYYSGSETPV